eukprot:15155650-Ditylum_brightwellii.AAC.1
MIKTELEDKYISQVNWHASNIPWCTGHSLKRFCKGLDLLIHKRHNDNRVSKLRPILLFNIEANMHNKCSGEEAMCRTEIVGGISMEQYGSRKNQAADLQALNTCLFLIMSSAIRH